MKEVVWLSGEDVADERARTLDAALSIYDST